MKSTVYIIVLIITPLLIGLTTLGIISYFGLLGLVSWVSLLFIVSWFRVKDHLGDIDSRLTDERMNVAREQWIRMVKKQNEK